ncbi:hypothetical protein GF356_01195 [candidate division GN15 bacterium]|nr:hypothetical protein [candidate division GN15 bacterium]
MNHLRCFHCFGGACFGRLAIALLIAAVACIIPAPSTEAGIGKARPRPRGGAEPVPQITVFSGHDFDLEAWNLGAGAVLPLGPRGLRFMPSGDMIFTEDILSFQGNADLVLGRRLFYVGGGLAVLSSDLEAVDENDTEFGANLIAGMRFPARRSPVRPYIETRWTLLEDQTLFKLRFGLAIPIGRP